MKSMVQRAFASSDGLYTVEGAFTIVIFTVLIMMLLSMMTVVQTEMEVQNALDQVAMELMRLLTVLKSSTQIRRLRWLVLMVLLNVRSFL